MPNHLIKAASVAALLVVAAAEAAPVLYDVKFDGSAAGDPGTGSFRYDADTGTMLDFVWDFGAGRSGGIPDSVFDIAAGGITLGQLLFEIVTSTSPASSAGLRIAAPALVGPFPDGFASFCWKTFQTCGGLPAGPYSAYYFDDGGDALVGKLAVVPASVPEPAMMAVLGLGLAGLAVARTRPRGRRPR